MLNAYGRYKQARDGSWQALLDNMVVSLPVDIVKVANDNSIKLIKNSEVNELRPGESGISIYDGNEWFIVYDDTATLGHRRFTVAHELGHIFLGHPLIAGFHARSASASASPPPTETQANVFARDFLSPACVLWGLDVHTAADIADTCQLSIEAAEIRAERMSVLYKRNKFLTSPLERQVFERFKTFIDETRPDKGKK